MILITGGQGFIGSSVAWYLLNKGHEVLLLGRRPFQVPSFLAPFWGNRLQGTQGDLLDLPNLVNAIKEYSVDSIIHVGALFTGSPYQTVKVNIEGTTNVLEAGRIFGLRRISFISSLAVYRGVKAPLLHEDLDLAAKSDNDVTAMKKACEQICCFYSKQYGLNIVILRPALMYGPLSHRRRNPIPTMVENAVDHKPSDFSDIHGESKGTLVPIYVYGGRKSSHLHIKDCAKGIGLLHLTEPLKHNIYNIGPDISGSYSFFDVADAIREVMPDSEIHLGTVDSPEGGDFIPLDIERLKTETGFVADYDMKRGIKEYIDWLRDGKY